MRPVKERIVRWLLARIPGVELLNEYTFVRRNLSERKSERNKALRKRVAELESHILGERIANVTKADRLTALFKYMDGKGDDPDSP